MAYAPTFSRKSWHSGYPGPAVGRFRLARDISSYMKSRYRHPLFRSIFERLNDPTPWTRQMMPHFRVWSEVRRLKSRTGTVLELQAYLLMRRERMEVQCKAGGSPHDPAADSAARFCERLHARIRSRTRTDSRAANSRSRRERRTRIAGNRLFARANEGVGGHRSLCGLFPSPRGLTGRNLGRRSVELPVRLS